MIVTKYILYIFAGLYVVISVFMAIIQIRMMLIYEKFIKRFMRGDKRK